MLFIDNYIRIFKEFKITKKTQLIVANIDKTSIEQRLAVHIVQCCQQCCSALLHPFQAQQYCSILLSTMYNVEGKTFFNSVAPHKVTLLALSPYLSNSIRHTYLRE